MTQTFNETVGKVELECKDLGYAYLGTNFIFKGIDIKTYTDELVAIVGPSGTGKSTFLRVLANLIPPTTGHVFLNNVEMKAPSSQISLVHQSIATFPWMTALDNVKIVLRNKVKDDEATEMAKKMIALVGLHGHEDAYPKEMSGGMRQRIAIARALAASPTIMLMDEPFVHLDELTANSLRSEIYSIVFNPENTLKSVILVSHNLHEVVQLADRVYVMGGTPARIVNEIKIDLPRPRSEEDPLFYEYVKTLYKELTPKESAG
ncbi:MAG: ABC transporter ATP-binding protein [Thaumarchaeota archaeon]|nr:ABC transporter ATP-binding protein [Nitrososphaerota archaeon]